MAAYIGSFMIRMLRLVKSKRASEEQTDEEEGEMEGDRKEEEDDIEEDEDTVMPAAEEGGEKDGDEEGEEEEYKEAMSFDECEDDVFENDKEEMVVDFVCRILVMDCMFLFVRACVHACVYVYLFGLFCVRNNRFFFYFTRTI